MGLIEHAKREFKAVGYNDIELCEDDPNKWIQENVLELLEVFAKQGHSGSSAPFCIDYFKKLASFEPLCPLKGTDDEWTEYADGEYQNKRSSHVFKDKTGRAYDIYGIIWYDWYTDEETGEKHKTFFTSNKSCVNIEFPYTPVSEYREWIESEHE